LTHQSEVPVFCDEVSHNSHFRRSRVKRHVTLILRFSIVAAFASGWLDGCGRRDETPAASTSEIPATSATETSSATAPPSREDVIQAVRRSVEGKTHTVVTRHQQPKRHTCSQLDVDRDRHMPRNPEKARCPRVGATYLGFETVTESHAEACDPVPRPGQSLSVEAVGRDKWIVSDGVQLPTTKPGETAFRSTGTWAVEKHDSTSSSPGQQVTVSGFVFTIKANQEC